jgi:hypothetical protein
MNSIAGFPEHDDSETFSAYARLDPIFLGNQTKVS